MRENRNQEVLNFFIEHPREKFTLENLSNVFGVSTRQVKNYIYQINEESEKIKKDKQLYYLNPETSISLNTNNSQSPKHRVNLIISKLLRNSSVDIFDLADELYVSRPTIEKDLKNVRKELESFKLTLKMVMDQLSIEGSEKNKRRLSSYLIKTIESKGFSYSNTNMFLNNQYDIDSIRNELIKIFNESEFIYNDYSINNILLHLTITIDRIKNGLYIEEIITNVDPKSLDAAIKIAQYIEKEFAVKLDKKEINNLGMFLSCNLATVDCRFINLDYVKTFISKSTIDLAYKIVDSVIDYYYLESFDDVFMTRFILHIDNLIKRQEGNFSANNPLQDEIFESYPLIYDTAVFAADIFKKETGFVLNKDEISLIALHIGSSIETKYSNKNKLTAIYVYADYHSFYQRNIVSIQNKFKNELNIKYSISSLDHYSSDYSKLVVDFVISEVSLDIDSTRCIKVSPFVKEEEMNRIHTVIENLKVLKTKEDFKSDLKRLFSSKMFFRNLNGNNEIEIIQNMISGLKPLSIFKEGFEKSVIDRENIASTCFVKNVAIPHAIDQCVNKSFISIVNFDTPQKWHDKTVTVCIMIGISYEDRKIFRFVFSNLVEFLNYENNVISLSKCKTYEEIISLITK